MPIQKCYNMETKSLQVRNPKHLKGDPNNNQLDSKELPEKKGKTTAGKPTKNVQQRKHSSTSESPSTSPESTILTLSINQQVRDEKSFQEFLHNLLKDFRFKIEEIIYDQKAKVFHAKIKLSSMAKANNVIFYLRTLTKYIVLEKNPENCAFFIVYFKYDKNIMENIKSFLDGLFRDAKYELPSYCLKTNVNTRSSACVRFSSPEEGCLGMTFACQSSNPVLVIEKEGKFPTSPFQKTMLFKPSNVNRADETNKELVTHDERGKQANMKRTDEMRASKNDESSEKPKPQRERKAKRTLQVRLKEPEKGVPKVTEVKPETEKPLHKKPVVKKMETKKLASKEEILLVSIAHLDLESSKFEEYLNLIFDGLCYSDMDVSYRSSKVYDIRVTFPSISELNQALEHLRKIRNHIVIEKNSECDSLCDVFFERDESITKNIQAFFRTLFYEANYELQSFCLKTAGEGMSNASVKFRTAEEGYLATEYVLEYVPNCLKQIMVVQKLDHLSEHHLKDEKFENAIVDLVICKKKDGERSVKIKESAASKIRQEDSSIMIPSLSTAAPEELDILDRGSIIHIQITHSKKSHHGKRLKQHLADILKNFVYSIIKFQWNNSRSAFDISLKFYNRQEALSAHCFLCTLANYFVIEKCYSNAKAMVLYTKSNIPDEERFRGFLTNVFNGKKFDVANYSRVEKYTTAMVVFTNEDDARDATYWFMRRYPRTLNQMLIVDPIDFGDSKVITSEKKLQTIPTDGDIIGMTMDKDLGVEVIETRMKASDFKNNAKNKNTMKNETDTLGKNKIEKKSEAKVQEKDVAVKKKKEIKVHGKDGANVPKNSDEKNPKNVLERHPSKDLPKKKKKTLPKEKTAPESKGKEKMAPKSKVKDLLQVDENDNVIEDKNKQLQATYSGMTTAEPIQKPSESSVQNEKKTERPFKKGQRRIKTGKTNVPITSITAAILDSEMRQSKGYFDHREKPKIKNDQKSNNIPKWHLELGFQSFESDKAKFTTYLRNLFYNHDFEVTNFKHDPRLSLNNIEVKFPNQKSAQEFTDLVLDLPITRGLSVIIIGEVRRSDLTLPIGFVEDFSGLVYKDLLSRLLEDKLKFKFQMHYGKNNLTLVFHRKGDAKAAVPLILQMIPFLPPALRISTIGMSNQVFFNTAYPPDGKPYRPEDAAASPLLPASKKLEVKRQYDAVSRHFKIRSSKTNKKEMVFVPVTYTISQNHPKHITSALKEAFKPFRFRTTDFQRPNRRLNKVRMGFGSKKSARTVSNFFKHYEDTEVSQSESLAKSFEKDAFYDDEFDSLPNLSSKWNKKAKSIMKKQRAQAKLQRKFNRNTNRSKKLDRIVEVGKITSRSRRYVSPRIITDISVTRSTTDNEVFEKEFRKLMDGYDFEILGIHNIGNINRVILEFPSFAEEKNAKEYINDLIDGYERLGKVIPGKAIDEETISEKSLRPLHREPYEFRVPLLDGHR